MNIERWIEVHGFDVHGGCPGREPLIAIKESDLRALFKDNLYTSPQAAVQPIAAVTGYHSGHCVIEPIDRAMLLPVGMALYAHKETK